LKLSIIIPCFNCSFNIVNLLDSINSNHQHDFEIILINDGSSDNTEEVILKYKEASKKNINLYSINNQGAARARSYGLSKTQADYVFFCDSDDYLLPDSLDGILSSIDIEKPDILYFNSLIYDPINNTYNSKVNFINNNSYTNPDCFLMNQLSKNNYTSAVWTYVFSTDLLKRSSAKFTERTAHEDHFFTLSLITHAKKIYCIARDVYVQKITQGSLTNSEKDFLYLYSRLDAFFESNFLLKKSTYSNSRGRYQYWSIKSFLNLAKCNKKSFFKLIFYPKFYGLLILNFTTITSCLYFKFVKYIKGVA